MTLHETVCHAVSELGSEWDVLFASGPGLQMGRPWLAASSEAALPPGTNPLLLGFADQAGPLALFPMVQTADGLAQSLTTPYTCHFQPLLRPEAAGAEVDAAMAGFARHCRRWPIVRLEGLDPAWIGLEPLRAALRKQGLASRTFTHFVNWSTEIPGGTWDGYLQSRPGALRETIRRKLRAAARSGQFRMELARSKAELDAALPAYEHVYARSWKEPEPYPAFNATLLRYLAETDSVRMFLLWRGEDPIAAQYWTIESGRATVLKLAHDETFKAASPGTLLTADAIRHLIEAEQVVSIDFGRGDDAYKSAWTGERRLRIGLLSVSRWTRQGFWPLLRHDLGALRQRRRSQAST